MLLVEHRWPFAPVSLNDDVRVDALLAAVLFYGAAWLAARAYPWVGLSDAARRAGALVPGGALGAAVVAVRTPQSAAELLTAIVGVAATLRCGGAPSAPFAAVAGALWAMPHGPGGALVWIAGLVFLFRAKDMRPYRLLAWHFAAVIAVFLLLNGKSYYTLGLYPAVIAAGAASWERMLTKIWSRTVLLVFVVLLALPLLPAGIPLWPAAQLKDYFHWLTNDAGIDAAVRWEDGQLHDLPQDFADMLGWHELAALTDTAFSRAGDPQKVLVYCENYGQAGAVEQLGNPALRPRLVSFADSYRLRVSERLPGEVNTLIYVNDELGEDVANLFANVQKIGEITDPLARERGTTVWLCRQPSSSLPEFWAKRVGEVKALYGLP